MDVGRVIGVTGVSWVIGVRGVHVIPEQYLDFDRDVRLRRILGADVCGLFDG